MSTPEASHSDSEREPLEQLAEEFVERFRRGERASLSEYIARRPDLASEIGELFPALVLMERVGMDDEENSLVGRVTRDGTTPERIGDYRILREVGRGGMGIVYEAEQESLGRHVALKVLPFRRLIDTHQLKRFQREARAAARLHHTNIVPVYAVGESDGIHYFAMQFIRGQSLDEVMQELQNLRGMAERCSPVPTARDRLGDASLSSLAKSTSSASSLMGGKTELSSVSNSDGHYYRRVAHIGAQLADALAYAHGHGILHRDVKPSNLMLDGDGKVWITDFGLAKTDAKEDLTHTGDLLGTLRYMAPERFSGWSDHRSDVYGLGLTLYELLTLRPAFSERDRARLIKRIVHDEPPRPRRVDHSIPSDLETIVLKSIAKEARQRYASATELAEDLRRYLDSKPIEARRTWLGERARMWCRRNPVVASLVAAVAALLIVMAASSTLLALWLRSERNHAVDNLHRALSAERAAIRSAADARSAELRQREQSRQAQLSLYSARLAQARAGRWSGKVGRRFEGLAALEEAAQVARDLRLGQEATLALRNEAIACMALVDLRIDKQWPGVGAPTSRVRLAFDDAMELYARLEPDGDFVVRRVIDNSVAARVRGFGDANSARPFICFSPAGRYLAAKGSDGTRIRVVVWELSSQQIVLDETGGGQPWYDDLDFSPDGRTLAFTGPGNVIHRRSLSSDSMIEPIPCARPALQLRFDPQGRLLAVVQNDLQSGTAEVHLVHAQSGQTERKLLHPSGVGGVAWSSDGQLLAAACSDTYIYLWDVYSGKQIRVCRGHRGKVVHVAFNHADNLLVSCGWESSSRIWDPRTGRQILQFDQRASAFSRGDEWLSIARDGAAVGRWQAAPPRECRLLVGDGGQGTVVGVGFSPDGRMLVSARMRDGFRVWDTVTARQLAFLPGKHESRSSFFEADGTRLITSGAGVNIWPLRREHEQGVDVVTLGPPRLASSDAADSDRHATPLGEQGRLVSASPHGDLLFVDTEKTKLQQSFASLGDERFAAISPDGKWLATGTKQQRTIRIRHAKNGKLETTLPAPTGGLVYFSPDGQWLVTSLNGKFVFWDVGTWQESHRIEQEGAGFGQVAMTQDMRLMAVAGSYHVTLLDPSTGRNLARLTSPTDEQHTAPYPEGAAGIAFNRDGSQLAVGTRDGNIQLWDLALIRRSLSKMGLDWSPQPAPPPASRDVTPFRLEIVQSN